MYMAMGTTMASHHHLHLQPFGLSCYSSCVAPTSSCPNAFNILPSKTHLFQRPQPPIPTHPFLSSESPPSQKAQSSFSFTPNANLHEETGAPEARIVGRSYSRRRSIGSGSRRELAPTSKTPGGKKTVEQLWHQFFEDPSQWWDTRFDKKNARYPDFKHKHTGEALWVEAGSNPNWVKERLSRLAPGTVQRGIFSWNSQISKHVASGQAMKALEIFSEMRRQSIIPDKSTFVYMLRACLALKSLKEGKFIHQEIIQCGFESDVLIANQLIDMYCKHEKLKDAFEVFNKIKTCDVFTYTSMIMGCVRGGQGERAIMLYKEMLQKNVQPDEVTFTGVIKACASLGALEEGRQIHAKVIEQGFNSDAFVASCLIEMYAKCGSVSEASQVFKKTPTHDIVLWSTMIVAFAKNGQEDKALEKFQEMQQQGIEPDKVILVNILSACGSLLALEEGRHVHAQAVRMGYTSELVISNCLVDMYSKCGCIEDACEVFSCMLSRDVITWNAMIVGYLKSNQGAKVLELYQLMQTEYVVPNNITYGIVLNACAMESALGEGRLIHTRIIENGYGSDLFVNNCLIDFYVQTGCIKEASQMFQNMKVRDLVSWNTLIMGLVKCGEGEKAIELYHEILHQGLQPDHLTFVAVLNACSSVAALKEGRLVHAEIIGSGLGQELLIGNALIDMYSKCGGLDDARKVFSDMPTRDLVTWNAMIGGYAMHGLARQALELFEQMANERVKMDSVTFLCLLSACSHSGLLDEGHYLFELMSPVYEIPPTISHCSCMVDLVARARCPEDAEYMIKSFPCEPSMSMWMSLLGACRTHGKIEMAERVTKQVLELDPISASSYVLLANT